MISFADWLFASLCISFHISPCYSLETPNFLYLKWGGGTEVFKSQILFCFPHYERLHPISQYVYVLPPSLSLSDLPHILQCSLLAATINHLAGKFPAATNCIKKEKGITSSP